MKKMKFYYFSGTGNSKFTAELIAAKSKEKGILTEVINISELENRRQDTSPSKDEIIIFCSPTHGFNFPPIMLNFLYHFPKAKNKIVIINTRAGMKLFKFVTPGLSGIALYLASLIMMIKGYSIQALYGIDLPSNWISIHPGLRDKSIEYIFQKISSKLGIIAEEIISEKKNFKITKEIIQDLLISPIAIAYYFIGRFFLAKTFIASSGCDNCGVCIKGCPVKAIKLVSDRPFWTLNCESCMKCMSNCPQRAIETSHGFIISLVTIFYIFIIGAIYYQLAESNLHINNWFLKVCFETVVFIPLLMLCYRMNHYLMKYNFYSKLIEYTSLTKFKFWGRRYKSPKKFFQKYIFEKNSQ